ncbi:MAG TPA: molybdopterin molybdenumtransferase MoeA, partial [Gammaproteobacteria bacterium]|nr:molybdopterin molybdenumtransferase MoeA [Gammaproteobacteria bacterium]
MPPSHPGKPLTPIEAAIPPLLQSLPQMLEVEAVPLEQALGRIVGSDVAAPINVPPHANSAMDGYALRAADSQGARGLVQVSQRIAAGQVGEPLQAGTAARIFTGAPLPPGADAVVMQENTRAEDEAISILQAVVPGENVRAAGEDIVAGAKLFGEGRRLRPQDIGVLASVGLTRVTVRRALRVALLVTGDELVPPGTELKPGQIYNSNNYTIAALLRNLGAEVIEMGVVGDEFNTTQSVLKTAAEQVDVIISTGGVSVGEEDHVKPAVESLGGLDMWKLAIKPGKPFASGKVCGKQFFGLPGNPVSAFVTFVLLVRPALLSMQACDR